MNDYEEELADEIQIRVWSGFHSLSDVLEMLEYCDEDEADADVRMLAEFARAEVQEKREAEAAWPPITDCDRLDAAFDALNNMGIIALHYAGHCMSCGLSIVDETMAVYDRVKVQGYCFYHEQDVAGALSGGGLHVAYGDIAGNDGGTRAIGAMVKAELERQGLMVEWDGDPKNRLDLKIVWQRRAA